jgi:putative peptidoglycan lipid II flippase
MKIFRHAATVSFFTGLSRLLGFVREMVMAHYFGTTLAKSAFDVAFRIPNLFRRLFGEGALSGAFVPVFSEALAKDGRDTANRMAGKVCTMLAIFLSIIAVAGVCIISIAHHHTTQGSRTAAVLPLLRIMLPYMIFICLVALCMGILNAVGHFAISAATPLLLNVTWIAAVYLLCPHLGDTPIKRIYGVAWGVLLAGVLQLLMQIPFLIRLRVMPKPSLAWNDRRIREILLLFGPAALGMGVHQINVVIDSVLALWAGHWAPAALGYAERLVYLPLGLFATALSTVLLPTFSHQAAHDKVADIPKTLARSLYGLMLIMVPATLGLMALSTPAVQLAFESGAFDAQSRILTARALCFYAPGLIVFSLYKVLVPAFYALKDTRTPVRIGLFAVALNTGLNILLIITLPTYYKHAGLALATVVSSGVNCILLAILLSRRVGRIGWWRLGFSLFKVFGCSLIMVGAIGMLLDWIAAYPVFTTMTKTGQTFRVLAAMLTGLATYAICIVLFCRSEIHKLRRPKNG